MFDYSYYLVMITAAILKGNPDIPPKVVAKRTFEIVDELERLYNQRRSKESKK